MARTSGGEEMILLLVGVFGALGCVVRFLMEFAVRLRHPTQRPFGTVAANVIGTGLAGWATYKLTGTNDAHIHQVITSGFCGGLTTASSAFAIPVVLARTHHWKYSLALLITTPVVGSVCFVIGMSLAH